MGGRALNDADRFLMEAVDSVPDSADRRVDLSALADEEGFAHPDASAKAWEQAGYGRCEAGEAGLVFVFSAKGYTAAQTEAERLLALHRTSRRWKLPTLDMASGWVAGAIFVVAAVYSAMMFFWG